MFITLRVVNFIVAFLSCLIIAKIFQSPIEKILKRLVGDEIYMTWNRYIVFAIYVVGISGGVRVWDLEKYITPQKEGGTIVQLTSDRWVLEIYRTVIGALQSNAWMLLIFFLFALIAFVIVKAIEVKRQAA
jgi:hypothetical protein